jgi:hypothetical protein
MKMLDALLAGLALALAATSAVATRNDDDDDNPDPADRRYCSRTAALLAGACRYSVLDDLLIAKAKCLNISDASERGACLREARGARAEAGRTCKAQYEGRIAACALLGEGRYDPPFEPTRFDADFTRLSNPNPYVPLGIGNRWVFAGGGERNVLEVTGETKAIEGVNCIVIRDLVYKDDQLVEATDDWYAAGRDGSTWYCGEEVKDYESYAGDRPVRPELVSRDGSFKHGRDRDKAGVIMPARPQAGQVYREEFSLGNAEDVSQILSATYSWGQGGALDRFVPRDLAQRMCNRDCVVTKNWSLLEPGGFALKYYARGIGFFLETKPDVGVAVQLVECNFDARCVALPAP